MDSDFHQAEIFTDETKPDEKSGMSKYTEGFVVLMIAVVMLAVVILVAMVIFKKKLTQAEERKALL